MLHPDVPPELRGTYLGLCSDPMIEYFQSLGVTALELLPVHQFVVDRHLAERGLTNYWGYNSIGFFAPDVRYRHARARQPGLRVQDHGEDAARRRARGDPRRRLQPHRRGQPPRAHAVAARGSTTAPTTGSSRTTSRHYTDFTGTGNSLNMLHPRTIQLVMDSLRYWVNEMHVDGFRFDLAPVLARELYDVDKLSAFFDIMQQDPMLARREADRRAVGRGARAATRWATSPCAGRSGTASTATPCATSGAARRGRWRRWRSRLAGSSDIFSASDRGVYASINFVTAHDGYTLRDLVSYEQKHNEANGENNRDGHNDNISRNWGVGGRRRRSGDHRPALPADAYLSGDAGVLAGRPDALARRRDRAHAAGEQQRLRAGQRAHLDGLGPRPTSRSSCWRSRASCSRSGRHTPCCAAATSSAARCSRGPSGRT